jgi:putative NADPH-quinone reductase
LAQAAVSTLRDNGHEVTVEDLYASQFSPALTVRERESYYAKLFDSDVDVAQVARMQYAEALVLVFPTWWFSFPAILKGWFDRVWAPGLAYDHALNLGAIRPRLGKLQKTLAITSLGSPWWVDHLVLRQPVKRVLKTALLGTCAPQCRFAMLSLYQAESLSQAKIDAFCARIDRALSTWV